MPGTLAIIPARGGSKGIKDKNIYPVLDHPLVAYSIAAAKLCPEIERVLVSTDSPEIAARCRAYGAEVPFLRPEAISGDLSPDRDFVLHALAWLKENDNYQPEFLVHLRPTTPCRSPDQISAAIQQFRADPEASSLRSAHPAQICPYKWFQYSAGGYYQPIASDIDIVATNQPRQMFPALFVPNGYVDILSQRTVSQESTIHGRKIMPFITPEVHDIDNLADLENLAETILAAGTDLLRYLDQCQPPQDRVPQQMLATRPPSQSLPK